MNRCSLYRILKIQWFPFSILIFGQKICFLGPTIFKIPQPNWYLTSLQRLNLTRNHLTSLDLFPADMSELVLLDVSHNRIRSLARDSMTHLTRLVRLDLRYFINGYWHLVGCSLKFEHTPKESFYIWQSISTTSSMDLQLLRQKFVK